MNPDVYHFAQDAPVKQNYVAENDLRSLGPRSLLKQKVRIVQLTQYQLIQPRESAIQLNPRLQPVVSKLRWGGTRRMTKLAQGNLRGIQLLKEMAGHQDSRNQLQTIDVLLDQSATAIATKQRAGTQLTTNNVESWSGKLENVA